MHFTLTAMHASTNRNNVSDCSTEELKSILRSRLYACIHDQHKRKQSEERRL